MSNVSRIFVVEGDGALNRSLVNSLRKDGYIVQGVQDGTNAVRALWSDEYDIVICDLKAQGVDGLELLQWLRMYRPNTRVIMLGSADSRVSREQVLEAGATSYLEKPLDVRLLKEELRGILQQTGFSASLDSFDLLDVIQVINMSRKNIALVVNTGLEEQGILRFQNGELVWAEYGLLRGEEAFFALAAHKNGTVIHQPWNGRITSNVTQPLSRLIFQALQYRTKYARTPQGGEQEVSKQSTLVPPPPEEIADTPFGFVAEAAEPEVGHEPANEMANKASQEREKEWWELTGNMPRVNTGPANIQSINIDMASNIDGDARVNEEGGTILPATAYKTAASQRPDLPSWLTDQPTLSDMRPIRPSPLADSVHMPAVPATPVLGSLSPEWQSPDTPRARERLTERQAAEEQDVLPQDSAGRIASPERQLSGALERDRSTRNLQRILPPSQPNNSLGENGASQATGTMRVQRNGRQSYNYPALVSALQTLGRSVAGFVAASVVTLEGQPIAQVAVDNQDISSIYTPLSVALKSVLQLLEQSRWGACDYMMISSANRAVIIRVIGSEKKAFHVLVTTHEADPAKSLEAMGNVGEAIRKALN